MVHSRCFWQPCTSRTVHNMQQQTQPSITNDIYTLRKIRDHYHKEPRRTGDPMVWHSYLDLRKEVKLKLLRNNSLLTKFWSIPTTPITSGKWSGNVSLTLQNKHLTARMKKIIKEDFNQLFVSVGKFAVNKIQSFTNEWHLTLNLKANYFMPRLQALCKQFTLNSVESNQI